MADKKNFDKPNDRGDVNLKRTLENFDSLTKKVAEYLIAAQKRQRELERYNEIMTTILINIIVVTIYHILTR